MNFCGLNLYGQALCHLLQSPVLLPAWDVPPGAPSHRRQPRLPGSETQCHPQLVRRATCFSANKI